MFLFLFFLHAMKKKHYLFSFFFQHYQHQFQKKKLFPYHKVISNIFFSFFFFFGFQRDIFSFLCHHYCNYSNLPIKMHDFADKTVKDLLLFIVNFLAYINLFLVYSIFFFNQLKWKNNGHWPSLLVHLLDCFFFGKHFFLNIQLYPASQYWFLANSWDSIVFMHPNDKQNGCLNSQFVLFSLTWSSLLSLSLFHFVSFTLMSFGIHVQFGINFLSQFSNWKKKKN